MSMEYDILGRQSKVILPTPATGATGGFLTTPQANAVTFYVDDAPFSNVDTYEASPLNRPLKSYGAGKAWRDNSKFSEMQYEKVGTEIYLFTLNGTTITKANYPANSLYKEIGISERGNRSITYKDKLGRVVQKSVQDGVDGSNSPTYINTSYLFDQFDRLLVVISPELYKWFITHNTLTITQDEFKEGAYFYEYDRRGRLISKQVPGAGISKYVYDKFDRVVLENDEKDANTTPVNYYIFKKYDQLGRIIMTGLINNIGGYSRSQLQDDFDNYGGLPYETRTASGGLLGYTNTSFPSSYTPIELSVKSVTYYDNYDWNTNVLFNFQPVSAFHAQEDAKGMMAGKIFRNLKTATWQKVTLFYDFKKRVIQEFHLTNLNNLIRKDYQYRFNGELLKMRIEKKNSTNVLLSTKIITFDYDHLGRKIAYIHNGKTIVKLFYDEIGRLQNKRFSPSGVTQGSKQTGNWTDVNNWLSGTLPALSDDVTISTGQTLTIPTGEKAFAGTLNDKGVLQNFGTLNMGKATTADLYSQNYFWHIRGGLKGINLDNSGNLTNALFSYRLDYENGTNGYFDGNIGKQWWKSNIDNKERSYTHTYDEASRLKSSTYTSTQVGENYALNNVSYDKNGNITNLSRSGATNTNLTSFGNVDNLNYTYQGNSNKLAKIQDLTTINADLGDFRDGSNTDDDYEYWQDGSLKRDKNKNISLTYNYLKLPETITFDNGRTIITEYDAEGTKLKKADSNGETTDYEEDDIYVNDVLYQTSNDEGRINAQGQYEYNINDHLGNLRVSFRDSLGIAVPVQSIFYDPWGLSMKGMSITRNPLNFNKYTFQGKELESQTGEYDFETRMYDPIIGRMRAIDAHAENYYNLSGYSYVANNPILYIDPDGRDIGFSKAGETTNKKTGITTITYNINVSMAVMNSSSMSSKDYQSAVSSFTSQLTKSLSGTFNSSDKTKVVFQAGDIDVRSVSSMSDVKSSDHLMVVVDNVMGMDAKGGQAGGLSALGGKIAYVEASNVSGAAGNMVHEFGHNMGLIHNWRSLSKDDDGATNYMGYGAIKNQMVGSQLNLSSIFYNTGQLNKGENYEILKQDYNTNGRTTQQMPLQYNVGRGGRIPRTLKN